MNGHHCNEIHTPPCSRGPVGFTEGWNSPCLFVATESGLLKWLMVDVCGNNCLVKIRIILSSKHSYN